MSSINRNAPPPSPRPAPGSKSDEPTAPGVDGAAGAPRRPAALDIEQRPAPANLPPRKMSQAEAERFYSQAGFSRAGRKPGSRTDASGAAEGQLTPLLIDEVDETAWEQEALDHTQQELSAHSTVLGQLGEQLGAGAGAAATPQDTFASLLGMTHAPTQQDLAKLEALSEQPPPPTPHLAGVQQSLAALFGKRLEGIDTGSAMLAVALVVAGAAEAVQTQGDGLASQALVAGMQQVLQRGHGAVQDAKSMSSGISLHRAKQQTLINKR